MKELLIAFAEVVTLDTLSFRATASYSGECEQVHASDSLTARALLARALSFRSPPQPKSCILPHFLLQRAVLFTLRDKCS